MSAGRSVATLPRQRVLRITEGSAGNGLVRRDPLNLTTHDSCETQFRFSSFPAVGKKRASAEGESTRVRQSFLCLLIPISSNPARPDLKSSSRVKMMYDVFQFDRDQGDRILKSMLLLLGSATTTRRQS